MRELNRKADAAARRLFVNLKEAVLDGGGEVKIFSSMHTSGEQLQRLGGVAALLRFPCEMEEPSAHAESGNTEEDLDDISSSSSGSLEDSMLMF